MGKCKISSREIILGCPKVASWGWKGILAFRMLVLPNIKFLIRNGHKTKFWNDSWLRDGQLSECYVERAVYGMGMATDIYVSRFIADTDCSFPRPTSNALMDIFHKIPLEIRPCSGFEDEIV